MGWNAIFASGADALKLYGNKKIADNIIDAINERCLVVGESQITAVTQLEKLNFPQTIQSKITTLIPLFVNHTDNSGNWDGQTSIPNWTEADILTEIGAVARIDTDNLYALTSDWCYQQYQIINLLRWTGKSQGCLLDSSAIWKGRTGGATYAEAVTNWLAGSWGNGSYLVGHYCDNRYGGYAIARHSNTYQVQNTRSELATIDAYCPFQGIGGSVAIYENNDYPGYDSGDYLKIASGVDIAIGAYITSVLMGKIETVTVSSPPGLENIGWYLTPTAVAVYKFDDYFDFKDW